MLNSIVSWTRWALSCLTLNLDEKAICANKSLHVSKKAIKINNKSQLLWHLLRVYVQCSNEKHISLAQLSLSKMKTNSMVSLDQIKYRKSLETDKSGHKIWWGDSAAYTFDITKWPLGNIAAFLCCCVHIIRCHWLLDMMHERSLLSLNRQNERDWGWKNPLVRMFDAEDVINWDSMFHHVLLKCVSIEKWFFLGISLN